jgi:ketosteroid isomerase-like protein
MGRVENEALARALNEAFDQRDMQRLDSLIADDVVWHQIGGPDIRGKAALRATPQPGAGADYDRTAEIYHVRNGQVIERWAFSDDTAAIARFFA